MTRELAKDRDRSPYYEARMTRKEKADGMQSGREWQVKRRKKE